MVNFEELDLDDEKIKFDEAETLEEVKKALNAGYGAILSKDKRKGIYYSEEKVKLYFFECCEEDEDLITIENYELMGKEISIQEADDIIEQYLKILEEHEERKKGYYDWLS